MLNSFPCAFASTAICARIGSGDHERRALEVLDTVRLTQDSDPTNPFCLLELRCHERRDDGHQCAGVD